MITPPSRRDNFESIVGFNLFAYHTERENQINKAIEYLGNYSNPNNQEFQNEALHLAGLCFENLTSSEINYIEEKVAQKWLEHQL